MSSHTLAHSQTHGLVECTDDLIFSLGVRIEPFIFCHYPYLQVIIIKYLERLAFAHVDYFSIFLDNYAFVQI